MTSRRRGTGRLEDNSDGLFLLSRLKSRFTAAPPALPTVRAAAGCRRLRPVTVPSCRRAIRSPSNGPSSSCLHTTCQRLAVRADYTDRSGAAVLAKSRERCKLHHTAALGPARSVSGSSAPLSLASGMSLSVSLPASTGCMAPVASHSELKDQKHMYTNEEKSAASSCALLQPHSWVQPGPGW